MTGIYLICFLLFPAVVLVKAQRSFGGENLLEGEDTNIIKGIATCFVIFAHLVNALQLKMGKFFFLDIFTVMGGMGVLLFFFVSGYGIYKGYAHKKPSIRFWKKRLINMYLPCVLIQLFFSLVNAYQQNIFNYKKIIFNSFFGAWFIDVILVQYLVFFAAWILARGKKNILISLNFILSMAVTIIFYARGFNARWYNGLLLFPVGMWAAFREQGLIRFFEKKWGFCLTLQFSLFVILGGAFTYWKGDFDAVNILKTLAGICLSLFVCTIFRKIKLNSGVIQYIGKRSLYFYLIHMGIMSMLETGIEGFYLTWVLTFILVEVFWRLYNVGKRGVILILDKILFYTGENNKG